MSNNLFYSHLVEIESINVELDQMDLSTEEKLHLAKLVDSSLHHTVLNAIFSELKDEDKRRLVNHINENDHDKIMKFLNERVDKLEEKIKKAADDLKIELHKDIKEAKKSK
jgi:hypothetical protein